MLLTLGSGLGSGLGLGVRVMGLGGRVRVMGILANFSMQLLALLTLVNTSYWYDLLYLFLAKICPCHMMITKQSTVQHTIL